MSEIDLLRDTEIDFWQAGFSVHCANNLREKDVVKVGGRQTLPLP